MTKITYNDDTILPFQVGDTSVRGRVVRLGPTVNEILSRHAFPEPLSMLLGEAAALVAMLGASLKFDGKLILQAQGDGPVSMMVADYTAGGALRATASFPDGNEETIAKAQGPELHYLLAKGHMVMTIDQGPEMERYQGVVQLEGPDLATATVNYFKQSEQIPTAVKLAVGKFSLPGEEPQWRAGGIMIQFMPGEGGTRERGEAELRRSEDEETWNNAEALLSTAKPDELLDPSLAPDELLYRLYHENGVRVFDPLPAHFECTCSREKIQNVLDRYKQEDLQDMAGEDGRIEVSCDFCREPYIFELEKS
jgi:molecular chaperone Hsp33